MKIESPLVSAEWLHKNQANPTIIILDATLPKATDKSAQTADEQIVGARFFDIKKTFSEVSATFPNTMLSPEVFEQKARELGINNSSILVVYDSHGIYSSARAWWMFRAMGHDQVAVLDGGLPAWKAAGYPTESPQKTVYDLGNFNATPQPNAFVNYTEVLAAIQSDTAIVDARSADRFFAKVEEPREGLRSGHIPGATNVPYSTLLTDKGQVKPLDQLAALLTHDGATIFTCGSGITACVLALGASLLGRENSSVYDGSWTEWGSIATLPIEQ